MMKDRSNNIISMLKPNVPQVERLVKFYGALSEAIF